MDLDSSVRIGSDVIFDRTFPQGIHIGRDTYVTNNVTILTHDHTRSTWNLDTRIGARCFIGNHAIIMPGIVIGDEVIVGAGSVVTRDVPSNCIVAGNPARIVKRGIRMNEDARLIQAS
jgi:acetyltransferase-like isoleucine patch superfamily enzyme